MNLSEPTLFKRSDKSRPARNTFLGDIEQYFTSSNNTCVHFGNNSGKIFVIKLLKSDAVIGEEVSCEEVFDSLLQLYPNREFLKDFYFFAKHNIDYEIVIIYDNCNWKLENNNVVTVDFKMDGNAESGIKQSVRILSQKDFQRGLVAKFGINRTAKPLKYATTEFEGFLSDISTIYCTRNDITLFPGDVDLLTYSDDYAHFDVFEFKKHTAAGGDSTLKEQSFLKYITRDRKKYYGLADLCKCLGKDYFFNVLYSTRLGEEKIVKIEKINSANLSLINSVLIEFDDKASLIKQIKNFTMNNY